MPHTLLINDYSGREQIIPIEDTCFSAALDDITKEIKAFQARGYHYKDVIEEHLEAVQSIIMKYPLLDYLPPTLVMDAMKRNTIQRALLIDHKHAQDSFSLYHFIIPPGCRTPVHSHAGVCVSVNHHLAFIENLYMLDTQSDDSGQLQYLHMLERKPFSVGVKLPGMPGGDVHDMENPLVSPDRHGADGAAQMTHLYFVSDEDETRSICSNIYITPTLTLEERRQFLLPTETH